MSPAVGKDGTVFVAPQAPGPLYAVTSSGNIKWTYQTPGRTISSPVLDSNGGVYVGSSDGYVYALSANGSLSWKYPANITGSSSIGSDGTVYCCSVLSNAIIAIN